MNLPKCPKCGKSDGVRVSCQFSGPAIELYNPDGTYRESFQESITQVRHGAVRCGSCGALRKDLVLKDKRIVLV